jgi:hypothetical protein
MLVNGPFGDPALCVDLRDERWALLFDLGGIAGLPPRKLLRLSPVRGSADGERAGRRGRGHGPAGARSRASGPH